MKYEELYLKNYQTPDEAYQGLEDYFEFYNTERLHQALGYGTPQEAYWSVTGKSLRSAFYTEAVEDQFVSGINLSGNWWKFSLNIH